jgi:thioredoxin 1
MRRRLPPLGIVLLVALAAHAQSFAPLDQWRAAVLSGNASALSALYTQSPAPEIVGPDKRPIPLNDEIAFWSAWKSQGLTNLSAEIMQQSNQAPGLHVLVLQLTLTTKQAGKLHKQYVAMAQTWYQQNGQWRLVGSQHTAATLLRQPLEDKVIYPQGVDANQEIAETLRQAAAAHKRVLLVFGGNWCFDCHVLDEAFHSPEIAPTLNKSFLVAHIDIGEMDKNLDIAKKYNIPLDRGVPAIAVLDSDGKLLFSQKHGEFEAARSMAPEDILAFLNKWKPITSAESPTSVPPAAK